MRKSDEIFFLAAKNLHLTDRKKTYEKDHLIKAAQLLKSIRSKRRKNQFRKLENAYAMLGKNTLVRPGDDNRENVLAETIAVENILLQASKSKGELEKYNSKKQHKRMECAIHFLSLLMFEFD